MKTLALESTPPAFQRAARSAKNGVLVLTRRGRPALAVVDVKDDLALEALALGRNARLMKYLDGIAARMRTHGGITLREVRESLVAKNGIRRGNRRRRGKT